MQTALQAPLSQGRKPDPKGRRNLDWNKVDTKVCLTGSHLVEMFSALCSSMLPEDHFDLRRPEQIPEAVKFHADKANRFRDEGDVDAFFRHAQAAALLKKVEFPLFEDRCIAKAMEKWFAAEAECKEMNERCADILAHPHTTKHSELKCYLTEIRKELLALLGEEPPSKGELADSFGFGPGADSTHTRKEGHVAFKQLLPSVLPSQSLDVLSEFAPGALQFGGNPVAALFIGRQSVPCSFEHARLEFVPKTCEEHRTIEVMPSLATYEVKGYDAHIRRRLKTVWGIDLQDQKPNWHLAFLGSIRDDDDSPVTLDLSSASDRISMGLVRLVLPVKWSKALFPLRSRFVYLRDGSLHELQKFSSMGNSITFSLQTAIFGAIIVHAYRAAGLRWKKWRVYGDDMIVIKRAASAVIRGLELCNFKLNMEKSFISGSFRESCGHDYLQGHFVRPFFIKKPVRNVRDLYKYVNRLQITALRSPIPASSFRGLFYYLLSLVPPHLRFLGSPAYGLETCIWSPIVVAPKRIVSEREVPFRIPDELAYRVALCIGGTESELFPIKRTVAEDYVANDSIGHLGYVDIAACSLDLQCAYREDIDRCAFEKAVTHVSRRVTSDIRDVPSGTFTYVIRRPGKPGLSPITDNERRKLLVPFWF